MKLEGKPNPINQFKYINCQEMSSEDSLNLKTDNFLDRVIVKLSVVFFSLTIVFTCSQIIVRWVDINIQVIPFYYTDPLSRIMLIVGSYFGAAVATRNNEHISIGIFTNWVSEKSDRIYIILEMVKLSIVLIFLLIAFWGVGIQTLSEWDISFEGLTLITSGMIYGGIAIGLLLMISYEIIEMAKKMSEYLQRH